MTRKNVYTIPSGVPFAKCLAAKLLRDTQDTREILPQYRILLPNRRACSIVRDAFLELEKGKPLLLPRLQPFGDIDEEELSIVMAGEPSLVLDIPPAMPAIRRQVLLAKLVEKLPDFTSGFDQAMTLAAALGRFMDQVYTESLDFKNLAALVPAEFSAHWQVTVEFLKILSEEWPKILAEQGMIDAADRRNRLINGLSDFWTKHPPLYPVIAAGSTGSIPATARLMDVITALPKGCVVLPGLDSDMDEQSWNVITDTHPQAGLKHLLQRIKIDRTAVQLWPCDDNKTSENRRFIVREMMRPAATTGEWPNLTTNARAQQIFKDGLQNLTISESLHEREEAETIAILLRSALRHKNKTAALITPDRHLARRVAVACQRWGINIDDSAGQSLDQTPQGVFLLLCLQAVQDEFAPVSLLSLLKHEFAACGRETLSFARNVQKLEEDLRGLRPAPGIEGLIAKIQASRNPVRNENEQFLRAIAPSLERFTLGSKLKKLHKFKELIQNHLNMAESVASVQGESGADYLWKNEAGEAAARLFAELTDYADLMPAMSLETYGNIIATLMKAVTVRPAYGTHPRLKILGQIEARMTDADLVILGGLNEDTWPADPAHDPWMSRPMRKDFGLPGSESSIGLAAHDFVQGFCAPEVAITRSRRSGGTPTVPSRWMQRLDTVLQAVNVPRPDNVAAGWAAALDAAANPRPFRRPEPRPPVSKRPDSLSVTRIEEWMRDPYSTYVRYILDLRKLEPLEKTPDAAERGKLLHKILKEFAVRCPGPLPVNAIDILHEIAQTEVQQMHEDPSTWDFWWPRFARIAAWLVQHESEWRQDVLPVLTETKGAAKIGTFTLEATPDRIDHGAGGAAIIDYKSGGSYSKKGIETGDLPQLALESLILAKGGFEKLGPLKAISLSYWLLTGGSDPAKVTELSDNVDGIVETTEAGLNGLIAAFTDQNTPYYSLPRPSRAPAYNDYEHLARVHEWTVLGDSESEAA